MLQESCSKAERCGRATSYRYDPTVTTGADTVDTVTTGWGTYRYDWQLRLKLANLLPPTRNSRMLI